MKESASHEKLGLKLLRALKREKDNGKSLRDCRPLSAVAAELRLSESEFGQAIRFLVDRKAIDAVDRADGKAALPSPAGEALLTSKKQASAWTMDRRLTLLGIIVAILSLVAVLVARCGPQ